jgi:hypothetical protein
MASTATPSPESISASEFQDCLDRYRVCLSEISEAKGGARRSSLGRDRPQSQLLILITRRHSQIWPENAGQPG